MCCGEDFEEKRNKLRKQILEELEEELGDCPRCKARLVLKTTKRSGDVFVGCSSFPKCHHIEKPSVEALILWMKYPTPTPR